MNVEIEVPEIKAVFLEIIYLLLFGLVTETIVVFALYLLYPFLTKKSRKYDNKVYDQIRVGYFCANLIKII